MLQRNRAFGRDMLASTRGMQLQRCKLKPSIYPLLEPNLLFIPPDARPLDACRCLLLKDGLGYDPQSCMETRSLRLSPFWLRRSTRLKYACNLRSAIRLTEFLA